MNIWQYPFFSNWAIYNAPSHHFLNNRENKKWLLIVCPMSSCKMYGYSKRGKRVMSILYNMLTVSVCQCLNPKESTQFKAYTPFCNTGSLITQLLNYFMPCWSFYIGFEWSFCKIWEICEYSPHRLNFICIGCLEKPLWKQIATNYKIAEKLKSHFFHNIHFKTLFLPISETFDCLE